MTKDHRINIDSQLSGHEGNAWFARLEAVSEDLGYFEHLEKHCAAFIDAGPKLLVTFENAEDIIGRSKAAEPLGFHFVRKEGWSHLGIYAHAETWYRSERVYRYFDRLIDEGFLEDFEDVLFYGADAGAYAAAAYSVSSPGCRVLAIRPQATLDPRVVGFDQRYRDQRIKDFTSRYGYAPDMVDAAKQAYVAFDPSQYMDAMHSALFTKPNVMPLRCNGFGARLSRGLDGIGILDAVVHDAMHGLLTPARFGRHMRARRTYAPYLRALQNQAIRQDHRKLAIDVCAHAIRAGFTRYFTEQYETLQSEGYEATRPVEIEAVE